MASRSTIRQPGQSDGFDACRLVSNPTPDSADASAAGRRSDLVDFPMLRSGKSHRSGPVTRPDLAERFPLILTGVKPTLFCQSQNRAFPKTLKRERSRSEKTLQLRGVGWWSQGESNP